MPRGRAPMSDLPSGAAPISDLPPVDRLSRALGDRLAWLFLISVALTCYEVMMDSVFDAPTIWVHDATVMLGAICFLFGGAYALQRRDHIRITFIYDALPRRAQRVCDLIGLVTGLVYLLGARLVRRRPGRRFDHARGAQRPRLGLPDAHGDPHRVLPRHGAARAADRIAPDRADPQTGQSLAMSTAR